MDYKEKYEQSLEKMKAWAEGKYPECFDSAQKTAELIFPELKESEGEKVRKMLIEFFSRGAECNSSTNGIPDKDILAWLEKHKYTEEDLDKAYKCADEVQYRRGYEDAKKEIEKQGEVPVTINIDKMVEDYANDKECNNEGFGKPVNCMIRAYRQGITDTLVILNLRKQGEQKPIKVEPKFREGDWLCENELNNYARFIQILETVNVQGKERYRISRDIHNDEDIVEFNFVEKYYHKFDIKDAKDGDVLYSLDSNRPFIYKERNGYEQATAYCGINKYGKFFVRNTKDCIIVLDKYVPATKEQRDTLMKAMADAGYTFDSEKKELKKIEQEYHCTGVREPKEATGVLKQLINEQKFDWSEDDNKLLTYILVTMKSYITRDKVAEVENWLKSLKDRVKPLSTQEWSEEDKVTFVIL